MDQCVEEKLGIKRPPVGYFSKIHVHDSLSPRPGKQFLGSYFALCAKNDFVGNSVDLTIFAIKFVIVRNVFTICYYFSITYFLVPIERDYKSEAAKVLTELPEDWKEPKEYKAYGDWRAAFFFT